MSANEYVDFNEKILKFVGLYPINFLRYLACLLSMALIVVPQVFQLYVGRNDVSVLLETSSVLLTILLAIFKSIVWLWNTETPKVVEFLLNDYWRIAQSVDLNNYMQRYAKSGRYVTRGYFFLIINALVVFFTIQPLKAAIEKLCGYQNENHGEKNSFPFPAKYPTFCYESPFYEVTYGSQVVATGICGLVILAMDTLIATALFHTCGHLKILHANLLDLDGYIDPIECIEKVKILERSKYSKIASTNAETHLANLVDHHTIVLRFADSMEKAFNPLMLLQVLASSLIICLVGFQLSSTGTTSDRIAEYFSYLVMALFQILLFCYPGDELITYSSKIGDAAFSINWYNASNQLKMGIGLMILRSQKPNCLTAGKFSKMSMESFSTILSTSMSYFTLLHSADAE